MFLRKKKAEIVQNDEKILYDNIVEIDGLIHEFKDYDDNGEVIDCLRAVDDVSLKVKSGEFIGILGHNGSGKSTLAKHINAILSPTAGTLFVGGMDTRECSNVWKVRQKAGMVFQNPDNQIVAPIVEEDVGFGPENLGVEKKEIWERVDRALKSVGMTKYRYHSPNKLSGGQKQRIAIAGVLAMHPECIVLDEPTAMLDPDGRKEVLRTLYDLNKRENVSIILITHYMDEVIDADRVFVMNNGSILVSGTPEEVFLEAEKIKEVGLDVPQITEFSNELIKMGYPFSKGIIKLDKFIKEFKDNKNNWNKINEYEITKKKIRNNEEVIRLENINYIYSGDTAFKMQALKDVSMSIYKGEFLGIIGHTGSGKSTLIQHLNGLLKADKGRIYYNGENIYDEKYKMTELRKKVGLVFQYPEYQLFETTVLKDVAFGPKNLGYTKGEAFEKAWNALKLTGIDESIYEKSPFELSGGQKRKVAIAGVLAMEPDVLVLDEPAAALDPKGRDDILSKINQLHLEKNITIIFVSHSMEDVAKYADRIIVMNGGEKTYDDIPGNIFKEYKKLEEIGLAAPEITYIIKEMNKTGMNIPEDINTIHEALAYIKNSYEYKERS